jgi:uncharacterized protein YyaL (SSP411 family)
MTELPPEITLENLLYRPEQVSDWWLGSGPAYFPAPMVVEFLLRHAGRTNDLVSIVMANGMCRTWARSSLLDQLGGGFHRYVHAAQSNGPLIPHFEKRGNEGP